MGGFDPRTEVGAGVATGEQAGRGKSRGDGEVGPLTAEAPRPKASPGPHHTSTFDDKTQR